MTGDDSRDRALEALLRTQRTAPLAGTCLDAETLAQWVDSSLEGDALIRAETHMADCPRCQQAMSALVASEPEQAPGPAPSSPPASSPWWRFDVRWLVPLAGAATAVLVWSLRPDATLTREIVVEEKRQVVADGRDAGAPAQLDSVAKPEGSAGAEAPALRTSPESTFRQPTAPAPARRTSPEPTLRQPAAPAAPAAPPAAALETRQRNTPPPLADTAARAESSAPPAAVQGFAASSSREIASGVPSVRWRLIGGGVERSSDSGATWTTLAVDGSPTLLAGSAPAATVCWVVGAGGTMRLTTDARTWHPIQGPTTDDLVAVEADSERVATVRTRAGAAFRTVDGGVTWTPQR